MKIQLLGSSWYTAAVTLAIVNTSCKPALTTTPENESKIVKII